MTIQYEKPLKILLQLLYYGHVVVINFILGDHLEAFSLRLERWLREENIPLVCGPEFKLPHSHQENDDPCISRQTNVLF